MPHRQPRAPASFRVSTWRLHDDGGDSDAAVNGQIDREVVLIEWKDRNPADSTFEGTARELMRVQYPLAPHPLGEMTFNPFARLAIRTGECMYLGAGDSQSGEQRDSRRLNPQRLDTVVGKILRIVPDLNEHARRAPSARTAATASPTTIHLSRPRARARRSGRTACAIRTGSCGTRIPRVRAHRRSCSRSTSGSSPGRRSTIIHKGANYGYSLREGTQAMSLQGMGPIPADDTIPVQISDTVTQGTVTPTYPVIEYPHTPGSGGDAIAGGFVYRGNKIPELRESSSSATSRPARSGMPTWPMSWRRTMAIQPRSRRFTRWTRASVN